MAPEVVALGHQHDRERKHSNNDTTRVTRRSKYKQVLVLWNILETAAETSEHVVAVTLATNDGRRQESKVESPQASPTTKQKREQRNDQQDRSVSQGQTGGVSSNRTTERDEGPRRYGHTSPRKSPGRNITGIVSTFRALTPSSRQGCHCRPSLFETLSVFAAGHIPPGQHEPWGFSTLCKRSGGSM